MSLYKHNNQLFNIQKSGKHVLIKKNLQSLYSYYFLKHIVRAQEACFSVSSLTDEILPSCCKFFWLTTFIQPCNEADYAYQLNKEENPEKRI